MIIPRICPLCAFIHLVPNQKIGPENPLHYALTLPNSRCQKNSCKVANQRKINKEKLKPSIILTSSHHILGFGVWETWSNNLVSHIIPKIYDNKKNDKLFISPLMNTNIKLGEKNKLERWKKQNLLNPIVVFIHIQSLDWCNYIFILIH
jgi:hypothetical protein